MCGCVGVAGRDFCSTFFFIFGMPHMRDTNQQDPVYLYAKLYDYDYDFHSILLCALLICGCFLFS